VKNNNNNREVEAKDTRFYYVYMLRCADESLYTGWTTDLRARLLRHNSGKGAKYTRARLPVILVYSEEVSDERAARRREAFIKSMTRQQKLALLDNC
jgi:putative endonuclease